MRPSFEEGTPLFADEACHFEWFGPLTLSGSLRRTPHPSIGWAPRRPSSPVRYGEASWHQKQAGPKHGGVGVRVVEACFAGGEGIRGGVRVLEPEESARSCSRAPYLWRRRKTGARWRHSSSGQTNLVEMGGMAHQSHSWRFRLVRMRRGGQIIARRGHEH